MTHYPKFFLNIGIGGKRLLLLTKNALMKRWQKVWAGPSPPKSKRTAAFFVTPSLPPTPLHIYFLCVSLFRSLKPHSSIHIHSILSYQNWTENLVLLISFDISPLFNGKQKYWGLNISRQQSASLLKIAILNCKFWKLQNSSGCPMWDNASNAIWGKFD